MTWAQSQSSSYYWADSRYTSSGTRLAGVGQNGARPSALCLSCHDGTVAPGDKSIRGGSAGARGAAVSFAGNLEGNHPVSVPYPAGGMANIYNGVTTGSALSVRHYVSDPTRLGIVLYRDNGDGTVSSVQDGAIGGSFGIECSSCHDVHNGPAVQDKLLLRGKLAGAGADYICVKCHML